MIENVPMTLGEFENGLASCPVMAVLRGLPPDETVRMAELAWGIGVSYVEIPIESDAAVPSLKAAIAAGDARGRLVGAGTIISAEQLDAAISMGAAYAVSPGYDAGLMEQATRHGFPFLPGVATPSELIAVRNSGVRWVKVFPASVLGADWFKAVKAPFPSMNLVATGGINSNNAEHFLSSGVDVVGVGKSLADDQERAVLARLIDSVK